MSDKRILKAKIDLMILRPFYGSLVVRLQLKEWEGGTFATDGKYIFYPQNYTFSNEELKTILAHETLHCALLHLFRLQNREKMKWNIACDYATNYLLQEDRFALPKDLLLNSKFAKMSAEKIYNLLPNSKTMKLSMPDLLDVNSEKDASEMETSWKEIMSHALSSNRGHLPYGMEEFIKDLLFPKISWQEILYKYLQTSKGMQDFRAYPFERRHIWREIYLPSLCGDYIEICLAIDTSGSIDTQQYTRFFSEIKGICEMFGEYVIHFWQCDAGIQEEKIITSESDIPNIIKGRGGTSFIPVFNRIEELDLNELPLIYLTDLDGDYPETKRNDVFWITVKSKRWSKNPEFGEVIEIDE